MRIVRYEHGGRPRVGIVEDGLVREAGDDPLSPEPGPVHGPLEDVTLLAPIERPEKIVCVGLNYRDHVAESGAEEPERPLLFGKFANALVGPGAAIRVPAGVEQVDFEAELGVVIGSEARDVTEADALSHVLGYTCVNDVSARDLQFADGQWLRGKSLDTFCPTGPWIVTPDEIADPQELDIACRVNGETMQSSTTAEMLFSVRELISFISRHMTLLPGDLIATGTPPGVGFARTPPVFLRDGDEVAVDIQGIGDLENHVEEAAR